MKRDWINKDEEFSGRGPKKYKGECWTKRLLKIEADCRRAREKYKKSPEVFEPGYEEKTKRVIRKLEKGKRKKRKKKNVRLWNNCIQLSKYSGVMIINYQYILKRREYRYKYEFVNYAVLWYEKERNIIYIGIINTKINEPHQRKSEILNCE
jgi:hypothetical protein